MAGEPVYREASTPRHRGFGHPFQAELTELLAWRRDVGKPRRLSHALGFRIIFARRLMLDRHSQIVFYCLILGA